MNKFIPLTVHDSCVADVLADTGSRIVVKAAAHFFNAPLASDELFKRICVHITRTL